MPESYMEDKTTVKFQHTVINIDTPHSSLANSLKILKKNFKHPDILISVDTLEFLVACNRVRHALCDGELTNTSLLSILKGEKNV